MKKSPNMTKNQFAPEYPPFKYVHFKSTLDSFLSESFCCLFTILALLVEEMLFGLKLVVIKKPRLITTNKILIFPINKTICSCYPTIFPFFHTRFFLD